MEDVMDKVIKRKSRHAAFSGIMILCGIIILWVVRIVVMFRDRIDTLGNLAVTLNSPGSRPFP
jgi:hypothetical protein